VQEPTDTSAHVRDLLTEGLRRLLDEIRGGGEIGGIHGSVGRDAGDGGGGRGGPGALSVGGRLAMLAGTDDAAAASLIISLREAARRLRREVTDLDAELADARSDLATARATAASERDTLLADLATADADLRRATAEIQRLQGAVAAAAVAHAHDTTAASHRGPAPPSADAMCQTATQIGGSGQIGPIDMSIASWMLDDEDDSLITTPRDAALALAQHRHAHGHAGGARAASVTPAPVSTLTRGVQTVADPSGSASFVARDRYERDMARARADLAGTRAEAASLAAERDDVVAEMRRMADSLASDRGNAATIASPRGSHWELQAREALRVGGFRFPLFLSV
jgi:hypothetical protein